MTTCENCDGKGEVAVCDVDGCSPDECDHAQFLVDCGQCDGTGEIDDD